MKCYFSGKTRELLVRERERYDEARVRDELTPHESEDFEDVFERSSDYIDWLIEVGVIDPDYQRWIRGYV